MSNASRKMKRGMRVDILLKGATAGDEVVSAAHDAALDVADKVVTVAHDAWCAFIKTDGRKTCNCDPETTVEYRDGSKAN